MALGGTSLAAVHLVSLIEAEYHASVPLADIFDAPSLLAIADLVARAGQPTPELPEAG
ncbi:MAG: acyl carrier protein [Planctomycetes bacterium]|nr:acyl carrier protein [Planctomycetota bacterium]